MTGSADRYRDGKLKHTRARTHTRARALVSKRLFDFDNEFDELFWPLGDCVCAGVFSLSIVSPGGGEGLDASGTSVACGNGFR